MSNRKLADRFGDVKAELARMEALAAALRQAILASGKSQLVGDDFTVTVNRKDVKRISMAKAKKYLSAAQIAKCAEVTPTDYVRVTPRAATINLFED